jgi:hypothetical protein
MVRRLAGVLVLSVLALTSGASAASHAPSAAIEHTVVDRLAAARGLTGENGFVPRVPAELRSTFARVTVHAWSFAPKGGARWVAITLSGSDKFATYFFDDARTGQVQQVEVRYFARVSGKALGSEYLGMRGQFCDTSGAISGAVGIVCVVTTPTGAGGVVCAATAIVGGAVAIICIIPDPAGPEPIITSVDCSGHTCHAHGADTAFRSEWVSFTYSDTQGNYISGDLDSNTYPECGPGCWYYVFVADSFQAPCAAGTVQVWPGGHQTFSFSKPQTC